MPRVNPGHYDTYVTLTDPVPDGTPVTFSPDRVRVSLRSGGVGNGVESRIWTVGLRYHGQITTNSRLMLDDGRQLVVMDIENAFNADRSGHFSLVCEEVHTP